MKKKLLALLLAAALLLSLCPLALAEFYAEVYNTESLNIRSGPGSSYSWALCPWASACAWWVKATTGIR